MYVQYEISSNTVTLRTDDGTRRFTLSQRDYYSFIGRMVTGNYAPHKDDAHQGQVYIYILRRDTNVDSDSEGFLVREDEWEAFRGAIREDLAIDVFGGPQTDRYAGIKEPESRKW